MSIEVKTVPYDKENDALRARCTDLTNRLVTADSMAIALEMWLLELLKNGKLRSDGYLEAQFIDMDIVDWFNKMRPVG